MYPDAEVLVRSSGKVCPPTGRIGTPLMITVVLNPVLVRWKNYWSLRRGPPQHRSCMLSPLLGGRRCNLESVLEVSCKSLQVRSSHRRRSALWRSLPQ